MNLIYDIPSGSPDSFNVVVEISKGTSNKYEYNPEYEAFVLNRVLHTSMVYPGNYGFIPQTIGSDDDPLDVLIISNEPIERGTIVPCFPLGSLDMRDNDRGDVKIIAFPIGHNRADAYKILGDFHPTFIKQIEHFFLTYKDLENKKVDILGWNTLERTKEIIRDGMADYWKYSEDIIESLKLLGFTEFPWGDSETSDSIGNPPPLPESPFTLLDDEFEEDEDDNPPDPFKGYDIGLN